LLAAALLVVAFVAWLVFNATVAGETDIETGTTPLSETQPGP
jgi:hypothetical protein